MLNSRPFILSLWCFLLSFGAIAQIPTICFKNVSDSALIKVSIPAINVTVLLEPKHRSGFYLMDSIPKGLGYTLYCGRQGFATQTDTDKGYITSGKWVMAFFFSKRADAWKSSLRPYDPEIDK